MSRRRILSKHANRFDNFGRELFMSHLSPSLYQFLSKESALTTAGLPLLDGSEAPKINC